MTTDEMRREFEEWFEREYPMDANGTTRSKYQNESVPNLMKAAFAAGRAAAVPELKPYDKAIQSGEPQLFSYDVTGERKTVRVIWPDGEGINYVRAAIDAAKGRSVT